MRVLAIDTALNACAAGVLDAGAGQVLAEESLTLERGHAEELLPLIERVISRIDGRFSGIDRVAVTIGPGSYTGLRVGIAAARAIGLAAGAPVVGVSTLSGLLAPLVATGERRIAAAAIDARHGGVYLQAVAPGGRTVVAASHLSLRDAVRFLGSGPVVITGSGAAVIAAEAIEAGVSVDLSLAEVTPHVAWIARLGAIADPAHALPKPLYLKGPDAKPQAHARVARR
ncbi:tRNA (adenosine(37)-N6)-threonylcarbamoyltransferase complex dimerization subunit type 1 TsaB [Salinarimonas soli]|uniref:tRNA (Adenosine(37)-N6)-threonylcarbamoyltransferase complex dimerization subunit type 1 TsaB n=1 Tax=Salinarimonas soli TaxID=1638099 RepID=A0A5B2VBG1_9HYPH|nr:tRNA (adenosine(37)-N6)-threonylcarbamoyltransferase complex dimerization subunit type 1 TsaB [Salinarimonas soli]KAA2235790.1 tRNA (adenosine(37)-N6)-threonylcarbamoyltransferase complex dimerization subunit type 1 TsaB [Salinarimonas soli]